MAYMQIARNTLMLGVLLLVACNQEPLEGFMICDDSMNLPDDSYYLIDTTYAGDDIFEIEVGYSGGCEPHHFVLCWDGEFMESDPIQVNLDLRHDANNDGCEAALTEELSFDLSDLRQSYESSYGGESGIIDMNLVGDQRSVRYEW